MPYMVLPQKPDLAASPTQSKQFIKIASINGLPGALGFSPPL